MSSVSADVRRTEAGFELGFLVEGAHLLEIPQPAEPIRRDGLWQETCFELFAQGPNGKAYREFNFAPSGEWAAYAFDDYRAGMRELRLSVMPEVFAWTEAERFKLGVALPLDALPGGETRFGLSAVIVEAGDAKSYWALAHPPGKPDFHHAACFAAMLPAPKRP